MGHFRVKSVMDMKLAKVGDVVKESDYSLYSSDDKFIQFEYVESEEEAPPYPVKPGIFSIEKDANGFLLKASSFVKDRILEEYVHTKEITDKIDKFFSRLHIYKNFGIEVPKRGMLFYGPPGTGKSLAISKVCDSYALRKDTTVVIWHTDKFEPSEVKSFIRRFSYTHGASKFILVAEDIGGAEVEMEGRRMRSDSSLLSLLDNVEKTFTVPTLILATTNFPQNMLGNLTNRPQRFDDKIEVKPPAAEFRARFLEFFSQGDAPKEVQKLIMQKKYEDFSVSHIKEIVIRAGIYEMTYVDAMEQILTEVKIAIANFEQMKKQMGLGHDH